MCGKDPLWSSGKCEEAGTACWLQFSFPIMPSWKGGYRKGPGGSGGHQVECELEMCPCSKAGWQKIGMHQE